MSQELGYYSTGRFLQFGGNIPGLHEYNIVNDKFVTLRDADDFLVVSITPLDSEGGQIIDNNNSKGQITIPLTIRHPIIWKTVDGDKLIATLFGGFPNITRILVIDPDNYQYQQYEGPNFVYQTMGIEGDVIYLSHAVNGHAMITGFNFVTGQIEYQQVPDNYAEHGMLGRMQDGTLVTALAPSLRNGGHVIKVVGIPDGRTVIEIEGDVIILSMEGNGVFYTQCVLENCLSTYGEHYFSTYEGQQFHINLIDNDTGVKQGRSEIVAVSYGGDSIWVRPLGSDGGKHLVNYKRGGYRTQKSARKVVF